MLRNRVPDLPAPVADLAALLHRLQPGVSAALGVALLGWGGSLWRLTQVVAGLLAGGALGWAVAEASGNPAAGLVAAAILAVAAAILFYLVERAAFAGLGAVTAVVACRLAWPFTSGGADPNLLIQGGAAVIGLALALLLHRRVVQATTAVIGAWLVAHALGREDQAWVVGGLALLGTVFQYTRGAGGGSPPPKPKKAKKA